MAPLYSHIHVDDADVVNSQIQREIEEAYSHAQPSSDKKRRRKKKKNRKHARNDSEDNEEGGNGDGDDGGDGEPTSAKKKKKEKRYEWMDDDKDEDHGESPSKKKKRNTYKMEEELYDVPGVKDLPPKRKTSLRTGSDQVTNSTHDGVKAKSTASLRPVTSYPGSSPIMSSPKPLFPHISETTAPPKSSQSIQEACLQSILKQCSQDKIRRMTLEESMNLNYESEVSPSPAGLIKQEDGQPKKASRWVPQLPRGYKHSERQWPCPVEGCHKSYSRKDSLGGHMSSVHSDQNLHDNEDGTFSIIADSVQRGATPAATATRNATRDRRSSVTTDYAVQPVSASSVASRRSKKQVKQVEFSISPAPPSAVNHNSNSEDEILYRKPTVSAKQSKRDKVVKAARKLIDAAKSLPVDKAGSPELSEPEASEASAIDEHRSDHDSSASSIIVTASLPASPKPIRVAGIIPMTLDMQFSSTMEPWEIAPGIINTPGIDIKTNAEIVEPVAYSAHHLRTNPNAVGFANVTFDTHVIASGGNISLPVESFARFCYVVSGKLQVHVEEAQFSIGKGGMFRVLSLEACVASNCAYDEALLHITSIKAEE